jgi:hypothetical protein
MVPRLAAVLTIVVLCIYAISFVAFRFDLTAGLSVTIFPMVILTMTIERASILWDEQGASATFKAALGSVISALLAYALMSNTLLSHLIVTFPELLLIVLALMLLMGRYNGYKLSEFYRFRKFKGVRS